MDRPQKKQQTRQFYTVSNFSSATFSPKAVYDKKGLTKSEKRESKNLLSIFSNIIPWSPRKPARTPRDLAILQQSQEPSFQAGGTIQTTAGSQAHPGISHQLNFCFRVTMEHVLIGNQNQLDLLSISTNKYKQLKYEKLWDITIGHSIDLVNVDMKKCTIAIISNSFGKLYVYRYTNKTIKNSPKLISIIALPDIAKNIYNIKQNLVICYENFLDVFIVSNDDTTTKKLSENYFIPDDLLGKVRYYAAPSPIDSALNIFFEENSPEKQSMFTLWVHEVQCLVNQVRMKSFKKVYDIQKSLKKKLKLKNFMKDTFLMNIGWEILAFKQGYILDSVSISSTVDNPNLRYLGDQKLVHVSDKKLELYQFRIATNTKPFSIKINPIDSLQLSLPSNAQFVDVLQVSNGNLLLLFAQKSKSPSKANGQLKYWLTITQTISLNEKFDVFFGKRSLYDVSSEELESYFDMSRKMGVSERDMFYQLWNRSDKKQADFHFLLKTKDHGLIIEQLKRILRKSSQPFTEIYKLVRNGFQIMKEELLHSQNPSKDMFFGCVEFSYLLKKLQYYRDVALLQKQMFAQEKVLFTAQEQESEQEKKKKKFTLSIKTYYQINQINVIDTLVQLAKDLIINQKPIEYKIRIFLNIFKFTLRMVYKDALSKIIGALGKDFNLLIQKIPQILPYEFTEAQKNVLSGGIGEMQNGFFDGVWGIMNTHEKQNAACFDRVVTIDNREMIIETMKQLNFRRSFLTTHCFITETSQIIQQHFEYIQSQQIFYFVIKKVLEFVKHSSQRKIIFSLIEQKYFEKLTHLKNRINLYYELYNYLETKGITPEKDGEILSFNKFLCLRDYEVFSIFFRLEKNRKGLILNQMKPIYEFNSKAGTDLFNECLLDYFKNPISSLSDIKYLLNRINNEKKEFHINNQHMYEILTEAMTFKLMVGTEDDIPLKEILIYIERVPMNKNSEYLSKLNFISVINENIQIIQAAHVNMSIHQILFNPSQLIGRLCQYLIIDMNVSHLDTEEQTLKKSYNILAKIQHLHHQIYKADEDPLFEILFIYLVKLSVDYHMFPHIKTIINDVFLLNEVNCTSEFLSDVVGFYLFRSYMAENKVFMKNEKFLRGLISIFYEDSKIREFIICQFEYAKRLSSEEYQVEYPLSPKYGSPGSAQLQTIIHHLKAEHILEINIDQLFQIMCRMKETYKEILNSMDNIEQDQNNILNTMIIESQRPPVTKKQIYEEFIYRLLNLKKLNDVIPYIEKLLECEQFSNESDLIIFPFLFLSELSDSLNYEGRTLFFKLSAYNFDNPQKLFRIIKDYMLTPRNMKERSAYLKDQVQKCQQNQAKSFTKMKGNKLLNIRLVQTAIKNGLQKNLYPTLEQSYIHSTSSRSQFDNIMYGFIFIILIYQPYMIAKYILCSKKISVVKNIRMFMNFLTKQFCFNPVTLMQLGSRVFLAVLYSIKDEKQVSEVISQMDNYDLLHDLDPEFYKIDFDHSIDYLNRLYNSSILFKNEKEKKVRKMSQSVSDKEPYDQKSEQNHYEKLLAPQLILQQKPISCSERDETQFGDEKTYVMDISKREQFDKQNEMQKLLSKTNKKRRKGSAIVEKIDDFHIEAGAGRHEPGISSRIAVTNSEEYNKEDPKQQEGLIPSDPQIPQPIEQQKQIAGVQEAEDVKEPKQVSLKEESKASQINGSEKRADQISQHNSGVPVIVVNYKKRDSSDFDEFQPQMKISPTTENRERNKSRTFREQKGLQALSERHKSKTSNKLDYDDNVDKVIRESSLHKADSIDKEQENHLEFKDFFNINKKINEAPISEENSPLLNPGAINEMKELLKDSVEESRGSKSERNKSRGSHGSKSRSGKSTPSHKTSKSHSIQIKSYKRFHNLPIIQDIGLQIYRNNALLLDNPKNKSFKISILTPHEKHQQFHSYMDQLIRYLYKETSQNSLVGIMRLIAFLVDSFKLSINKVHLQIWVRAENLSNKYQIGLNIREIMPIEPIFIREVGIYKIFHDSLHKIRPLLDDINVYKISKMIALAFQDSSFQHEIIYAYLQKIAFNHVHFKRSPNPQILKLQESAGELDESYTKQKIEGLAQKLPVEMICQKIKEIYQKTKLNYKEQVLRGMVNKVKKSGNNNQKIQVLEIAKQIDTSYEHTYQTLFKGR